VTGMRDYLDYVGRSPSGQSLDIFLYDLLVFPS
jgi:hypothetical protein